MAPTVLFAGLCGPCGALWRRGIVHYQGDQLAQRAARFAPTGSRAPGRTKRPRTRLTAEAMQKMSDNLTEQGRHA